MEALLAAKAEAKAGASSVGVDASAEPVPPAVHESEAMRNAAASSELVSEAELQPAESANDVPGPTGLPLELDDEDAAEAQAAKEAEVHAEAWSMIPIPGNQNYMAFWAGL